MNNDDRPQLRYRCRISALLLLLLGLPIAVGAQPVSTPRFDFTFSNPGARSLGFGGAFVALADDATAAFAKPAGLVQLTEPEVSLDVRLWNRTPSFIREGRFDDPDDRGDFFFSEDSSEDVGPSFVSIVMPKGRWSFALYGHQLATFSQRVEWNWLSLGPREPGIPPPQPTAREAIDLDIVTAGFAAAWHMNDRLSLGANLLLTDTSFKTNTEFFLPSTAPGGDDTPFQEERLLARSAITVDGTDLAFTLGALWQISEQVSAGLVYRRGADTTGARVQSSGPAAIFDETDEPFRLESNATFNVPDVFGLGAAYRSKNGRWTVASEVEQVGYRNLVDVAPADGQEVESPSYADAWNVHVGSEMALLRTTPIVAFRAGAWLETNRDDLDRGEIVHVTAGIGVAAERFQMDLAADLSDEIDIVSLSFIYRY